MAVTTLQAAPRPRAYVSVAGPEAAAYLNRMVSNEVEALPVGAACEALLLTPKARIVAPMVVWRRADDTFLLLTEPEAGERLARELLRARFAAKCEIALEEHRSVVVLGTEELDAYELAVPNLDYGVPAVELVDAEPPAGADTIGEEELERLRILARTPRLGRELDDRVMPAEAGLEQRAISFTKGCYVGQEVIIRVLHRGHGRVARRLVGLTVEGVDVPVSGTTVSTGDREVGHVTSAAFSPALQKPIALAYVHRDFVQAGTLLHIGASTARVSSLPFFSAGGAADGPARDG